MVLSDIETSCGVSDIPKTNCFIRASGNEAIFVLFVEINGIYLVGVAETFMNWVFLSHIPANTLEL